MRRAAFRDWLFSPSRLESLRGIKAAYANRLRAAGVTTPARLFSVVRSPSALKELSSATCLSEEALAEVVNSNRLRVFESPRLWGLLSIAGVVASMIGTVYGFYAGQQSGEASLRQELQLKGIRAEGKTVASRLEQLSELLPAGSKGSLDVWTGFDVIDPLDVTEPIYRVLRLDSVDTPQWGFLVETRSGLHVLDENGLSPVDELKEFEGLSGDPRLVGYLVDLLPEEADAELVIVKMYGGTAGGTGLLIFKSDSGGGWKCVLNEDFGNSVYRFTDINNDGTAEFFVGRLRPHLSGPDSDDAVRAFPMFRQISLFRWDQPESRFVLDDSIDWDDPPSHLKEEVQSLVEVGKRKCPGCGWDGTGSR